VKLRNPFQNIRQTSGLVLYHRRWILVSLLIALLCAVIVWVGGSGIVSAGFKPLVGRTALYAAFALILALWLVCVGIRVLVKELPVQQAGGEVPGVRHKAVHRAVQTQVRQALRHVQRVTGRRFGFAAALPWYLVLGISASGRSTLLRGSGCRPFPGNGAGAAGTDAAGVTVPVWQWWQSEDVIMIEADGWAPATGSVQAEPADSFGTMLDQIMKSRPAQPVNGVILTIPLRDIKCGDAETIDAICAMIRRRLEEVTATFRVRVPVYLVLTKADTLTGFDAFFSQFSAVERNQVWGITFPVNAGQTGGEGYGNWFATEFSLLQQRLDAMVPERLQKESDPLKRGLLFRFPAAFAGLKEPLEAMMGRICSGEGCLAVPFIRGIYLTSASVPPAGEALVGRSGPHYFVQPLLRNPILSEAALVMKDGYLLRRRRWMRLALIVVAAGLTATLIGGWTNTLTGNRRAAAEGRTDLGLFGKMAADIPIRNVNDADFLRILPGLDGLDALADSYDGNASVFVPGFTQLNGIARRQRAVYRDALNIFLLPRLMIALQDELDDNQDRNGTFNLLKFYGMLGGLGPVDRGFVATQADALFRKLYPGEGRAALREGLVRHVRNLVAEAINPINTDERRISRARAQIAKEDLTARAFRLLLARAESGGPEDWVPATVVGEAAEPAFERRSGRPLQEGIAGIYTRAGFSDIVVPQLKSVVEEALNERWVRGEHAEQRLPTADALAESVIHIYFDTLTRTWDALLRDIRIRSPQNLGEAAETARLLAGSSTPLQQLARSIAAATDFGSVAVPGHDVLARIAAPDPYSGLRRASETPDTPAAGLSSNEKPAKKTVLSTLQDRVSEFSDQVSLAATSSAEVAQITGAQTALYKANASLIKAVPGLPKPLSDWIAGMAADNGAYAIRAARTSLSTAWAARSAQACNAIADGLYPFDRTARAEITMTDFTRLFGPKGLFQSFFNEQLRPFVDTTVTPWRWSGASDGDERSSQALRQFENADIITRSFFPSGGDSPMVRVNINPVSLSDAANAVVLELEGERVVYFHGPKREKSIIWPSQDSAHFSRLVFQPGGWENAETFSGDWSVFRLLDRAVITQTGGARFQARFDSQDRSATFEVQFGSALNPFRTQALERFRCPLQF